MKVTLTRVTTDPVMAIEEAAANCYDSTPSPAGKIMDHCYKSGHTSVMEFANFTFHVEGVSRALLAQLTRHRHAGYAVRSQRYVNEDNFDYVIPSSIILKSDIYSKYTKLMDDIRSFYTEATTAGIPMEDARYVLPNACATNLEVTFNLRSLINFMNLRLCTRAQNEIRELAKYMRSLIVAEFPDLEKYLVPKCEANAPYYFCTEQKCCGRHPKLKEVYKGYESSKESGDS